MIRRLLTRADAAAYLGMSLRAFDTAAAPALPWIAHGARRRYDIHDLDKWVDAQPKIRPTGASQAGEMTCETKAGAGLPCAQGFGGSTSTGAKGGALSRFENRLNAGRKTLPARLRSGTGASGKNPDAL